MVAERKRKKGAREFDTPKYDHNSNYITVVMYYGGAFGNSQTTEYVGGKKVCFDWCKADDMSISLLNDFSEKVGVTGNRRYQLKMKDGSFKLFVDDADVKKWCYSFMDIRELHVYTELLDENSDSDDPDYKVDECNENDDALFDELVDFEVEYEYDSISTSNIIDEGPFVDVNVEVQENNVQENVQLEGQVDVNLEGQGDVGMDDSEMESIADLDYSNGDKMSEDDVEIFEDDFVSVQDDFEAIDSNNIIPDKGKGVEMGEGDETDTDSGESDVLEDKEMFDEGRVSEDDQDAEKFPMFNPQTKFNPEFFLKQVFPTKKDFKVAVESQAIKLRRNIKFVKNDKVRIHAKCHATDCKWMIHALKMQDDTAFQIRKIFDKHTCAPSNKVKCMTSTWLSERFLQRFKSDSGRSVKGFMADAMHDTRVQISKTQAYLDKKKAVQKLEGDPDAQYSKLWAYADELRKTNPGSTIILGTEESNGVTMFSMFYVCFHSLKQGFKVGCRKILGVDGCYLKGKHGGMLLSAVAVDANNNPFPVAYAVVEKENQDIWEWFLNVLKQDLEIKADEFTFMSDKQKGLIGAMEVVFPGVDHRFCVRHLHCNFKVAGFTGVDYKNAMLNAAYSTTEGQFNAAMTEVKAVGEGGWEWLMKKPPHQWSKAFFNFKSKCDMLLNNICETFNSNILEARDKPILTMLEWIREYLMVRLQRNRDRALTKWNGRLCPKIQKIMNRNVDKVNDCIALKCSEYNYQVSSFDGTQYTVDLKELTCTCRNWQLTGIPCTHAISGILREHMNPMDYVNEFYYVQTYNKTYEAPIFGISYDVMWGESVFIPPLPPNFGQRAKRGRKPHNKRRMEPFEAAEKKGKEKLQKMKRQCKPYKCKKCGQSGHNSLSCGKKTRNQVRRERSQVDEAGTSQSADHGVQSEVPSAPMVPQMHPPLPRRVEECHIEEENVGTQQSQITTSQPKRPGPSMHQQIKMGKKKKT